MLLVPSRPLLVYLPLSFVHLVGRGELLANVATMLHITEVIWSLCVHIVKEVFEFAEAGRLPIIVLAEVGRYGDRLVFEIIVQLLDLIDKILLKDRIN